MFHDVRWMIFGVLIIIGQSWSFAELTHRVETGGSQTVHWLYAGWVASLLLLGFVVIQALRKVFRPAGKQRMLLTILCAYFAIVVSFSSVYYTMAIAGNITDGVDEIAFYRDQYTALKEQRIDSPAERGRHSQAFAGLSVRLWTGPEHNFPQYPGVENLPLERRVEAAGTMAWPEYFRYNARNRLPLALDCFHFSVVTMTTVGYGDIVPTAWYSKLAADLQVLLSMVILILALQMVLGDWFGREKT